MKKLTYTILIAALIFPAMSAQKKNNNTYKPVRYQTALTKTLRSLEAKKKALDTKLAYQRKMTERFKVSPNALIDQSNKTLIETLQRAQAYINRRIETLKDENKKLAANKHGINNQAVENTAIKKMNLQTNSKITRNKSLRPSAWNSFLKIKKRVKLPRK